MVVRTRSKSKVDRLSPLPPELLSIIFDLIADDSQAGWYRHLCLISKPLAPFVRRVLYKQNWFQTLPALRSFVGVILARPEYGPLVRGLGANFFDPTPAPDQLDDPVSSARFWSSLANLEWVDFSACSGVIKSFLRFEGPTEGFAFHALRNVHIMDDAHGWPRPFAFGHYRRLLSRAPGLQVLTLNLPSSSLEDISAEPEDGDEVVHSVGRLAVDGDTRAHRSEQIAQLANHFVGLHTLDLDSYNVTADHARIVDQLALPNLTSLAVSEGWEPLQRYPFAPDLSRFPRLARLEVSLYRRCDLAWLASAPPTLEHFVAGPDYTVTASDLRALLGPGARRPAGLLKIEVDNLPSAGTAPDRIHCGRTIDPDHPVLRRSATGAPCFEPLGGWGLPYWAGADEEEGGEFEALVEVQAMARVARVQLCGILFAAVAVQEAYNFELAKCEVLEERYEAGELEWVPWDERAGQTGS